MATIAQLTTKDAPTWCPGCGDFLILSTLKMAIAELNLPTEQVAITSGIGCGSKMPHFVKTYGFEGLHGRALPVASGIRLANHTIKTITVTGDGDGYGIGGNHFLHTMRRNLNITHIIEDNQVYGLTKGQYSPTSRKGFKSPSTPSGGLEEPINPLAVGIAGGATFVARGYAMDILHLKAIIKEAIQHKGYSLVDVLQPCPTYNKINTQQTYSVSVRKIDPATHNAEDKQAALKLAEEWGPNIPIGIFYKVQRPTYEEQLPQLNGTPLAQQDIKNINMEQAFRRYLY